MTDQDYEDIANGLEDSWYKRDAPKYLGQILKRLMEKYNLPEDEAVYIVETVKGVIKGEYGY